jgi:hypothetical protein
MHNNDEPGQAGMVHANKHKSLVVATALEGETFEANNYKKWSVLNDLMLKGPRMHELIIQVDDK